jgi:hypothetical protein
MMQIKSNDIGASHPHSSLAGVDPSLAHKIKEFDSIALHIMFFCGFKGHSEAVVKEQAFNKFEELTVCEQHSQKLSTLGKDYFLFEMDSFSRDSSLQSYFLPLANVSRFHPSTQTLHSSNSSFFSTRSECSKLAVFSMSWTLSRRARIA